MQDIPEARIALCKCGEKHKVYGVRFEKYKDGWKYTWAFPIKESEAVREKYDANVIVGDLLPDEEYPGCPYCGSKYFMICSCGRLNCNISKDGRAYCEWCKEGGTVSKYDGAGIHSDGDF